LSSEYGQTLTLISDVSNVLLFQAFGVLAGESDDGTKFKQHDVLIQGRIGHLTAKFILWRVRIKLLFHNKSKPKYGLGDGQVIEI